MAHTFFISDTHFGHTNIIKYENRPFENVDAMDKAIIANWNNKVSKQDTVFFLGDFGLHHADIIKNIYLSLNGKIHFVSGNHDMAHSDSWWIDRIGVKRYYRYPIIWRDFYILSHKPVYVNDAMPYVNIHGHTHSKRYDSDKHFNVSVECINYTPIRSDELIPGLK